MKYLKPLFETKRKIKSIDDLPIILKHAGKYNLTYNNFDFLIISSRGFKNRMETVEVILLVNNEPEDRRYLDATFYMDDDMLTDGVVYELDNMIKYHNDKLNYKRERQDKIDKGYKDISPIEMKKILMEVIPEYIGNHHTAMTGSAYLLINGNELRISDHERPYNSKWNFKHGEYTNIKSGLFRIGDVQKYIEHLIDNKLNKKEMDKLQKVFNNI